MLRKNRLLALARLGKPAAVGLIKGKLPTTKQIRSGDLGEIYATEWIDAYSGGYGVPVKRLRWKDHRNMAMRGDDVIGIFQDDKSRRLHFLKTEAKSRATLTAKVRTDARAGLDKDGGLPQAYALSTVSARLLELDNLPLADALTHPSGEPHHDAVDFVARKFFAAMALRIAVMRRSAYTRSDG